MTLLPKTQIRFARRTDWNRSSSEMHQSISDVSKTTPILDLTTTNPTACGFQRDARQTLEPLLNMAALQYVPDPGGILSAREAVAYYYLGHGVTVSPEQIILTASTSEAYSHLFRLLCEPGDEVLIAQPGYPLIDCLADLSDVTLRNYPLFYDHGWSIDRAELERAITPRTRAIVVVHPNNPTGHPTLFSERQYLRELCQRFGICLIVDEVFLDYAHEGFGKLESFAGSIDAPLTFVLNGLSKIAALPQMKVGWIVTVGARADREEALQRLEIIADTFLSVNTPAQIGLPVWLMSSASYREQIVTRISRNLALLRTAKVDMYDVVAGWNGILRIPHLFDEESAFATLRRAGIVTHPAHLYGLDDARRVVISLIVPSEIMQEAVAAIETLIAGASAGPSC